METKHVEAIILNDELAKLITLAKSGGSFGVWKLSMIKNIL
ncbi:UNVERIFIED_CONTAM: hypothetical protein BJ099_10439 [Lysinibacillus xylanilyticus]|nr:hypothetical protein [Lysinibacillus xylanilyticus]